MSWRFWLACLMLVALPLKGLAAVGLMACCPPGAPDAVEPPAHHHPHAAAPLPAHPVHADATPAMPDHAAHAPSPTPSQGQTDHAHGGDAGGLVKLPAPCCTAAAMPAPAGLVLQVAASASPAPTLRPAHYRSASLAPADKPPRG